MEQGASQTGVPRRGELLSGNHGLEFLQSREVEIHFKTHDVAGSEILISDRLGFQGQLQKQIVNSQAKILFLSLSIIEKLLRFWILVLVFIAYPQD